MLVFNHSCFTRLFAGKLTDKVFCSHILELKNRKNPKSEKIFQPRADAENCWRQTGGQRAHSDPGKLRLVVIHHNCYCRYCNYHHVCIYTNHHLHHHDCYCHQHHQTLTEGTVSPRQACTESLYLNICQCCHIQQGNQTDLRLFSYPSSPPFRCDMLRQIPTTISKPMSASSLSGSQFSANISLFSKNGIAVHRINDSGYSCHKYVFVIVILPFLFMEFIIVIVILLLLFIESRTVATHATNLLLLLLYCYS